MLKRIKNKIKLAILIVLFIIAIIISLLALVQIVSAYIASNAVEQQYNTQFEQLKRFSLFQIKNYKYDKGLFSSDVSADISINSGSLMYLSKALHLAESNHIDAPLNEKDYTINYHAHINNGLFAGIYNNIYTPTLAFANSTITYPTKLDKLLSKFFPKQSALKITNIIYLDHSGKYEITSPSFDYEEALSGVVVKSEGLNAEINYNSDFTSFINNIYSKGFALKAPTHGEFEFKNLIYRSHSYQGENKIILGDSQFSIGDINLTMLSESALHFNLNDLLYLVTGINSTEFLKNIDSVDVNNFNIKGIAYYSNSKESYGYFSATSIAKFESLVTNNNNNYGPFNLNISIEHIPAVAFANLATEVAKLNSSSMLDISNYIESLEPYMVPIFAGLPTLDLKSFHLLTPKGAININGTISLHNFESSDMQSIEAFEQKVNLDLRFTLPKELLTYLFILDMRYFLSTNNANMDVETSESLTKVINIILNNQLKIWDKKGYITRNDDEISSQLKINQGQVLFNGILVN